MSINDEFLKHEITDRLYSCMTMVDTLLLEHPSIEDNEAIRHRVQKAFDKLFEAYNLSAVLVANGIEEYLNGEHDGDV